MKRAVLCVVLLGALVVLAAGRSAEPPSSAQAQSKLPSAPGQPLAARTRRPSTFSPKRARTLAYAVATFPTTRARGAKRGTQLGNCIQVNRRRFDCQEITVSDEDGARTCSSIVVVSKRGKGYKWGRYRCPLPTDGRPRRVELHTVPGPLRSGLRRPPRLTVVCPPKFAGCPSGDAVKPCVEDPCTPLAQVKPCGKPTAKCPTIQFERCESKPDPCAPPATSAAFPPCEGTATCDPIPKSDACRSPSDAACAPVTAAECANDAVACARFKIEDSADCNGAEGLLACSPLLEILTCALGQVPCPVHTDIPCGSDGGPCPVTAQTGARDVYWWEVVTTWRKLPARGASAAKRKSNKYGRASRVRKRKGKTRG